MNITILGAAREVTGSCYLVETTDTRFLADCGMAQGGGETPTRNRKAFAFDPKSIDFVLLTHLLQMTLPDSAQIQGGKAERDKRYGRSAQGRSAPRTPLYTLDDARDCLHQMRPIAYGQEPAPHAVARFRFRDAGHILGSAISQVWITEHGQTAKLVFSGDLGQPGRPILRDPTPIEDADIVVMESTYGNRAYKNLALSQGELFGIADRTLRECGVPTTGFQAQG